MSKRIKLLSGFGVCTGMFSVVSLLGTEPSEIAQYKKLPEEKILSKIEKKSEKNSIPLNILFIAVDDLKPLLGCYGDSLAITPNINSIGEKGTVFMNNHCQWAVCGPTRASLLTGWRPEKTGILNFSRKMRDVNPDVVTLPQYFKEHGYESVGRGKIFDPRCVRGGRKHDDIPSWSIPYKPFYGKFKNKELMVTLSPDVPDDMLTDGRIAEKGVGLIRKLARKDKPFFIAVGFKKPHLPFVAPQKYWKLYKDKDIKTAPFQKPADGVNPIHNYHNSNELRSYTGVPKNGPIPDDLQKKLIHGYYACVSFIDAQIGKLLNELKQQGVEDKTIICLWGDHGWHLGDHALWGKHTSLEQAARAPLIIYSPGYKHGKTYSPTEFIDIYPTLCQLAGLPVPENLDGKSLVPLMKDPEAMVKSGAITSFRRKGFGYSYRDKRYRYIEWINPKTKKIIDKELYDYKIDPQETKDFSKDPAYKNITSKLAAELRKAGKKGCKLLYEVKN